jgi:hypothetical protein
MILLDAHLISAALVNDEETAPSALATNVEMPVSRQRAHDMLAMP